MNPLMMAMPGALRMRALYPLLEADGSCTLIYDLERAAVLDVPEDLQLHVGAALDTGDPDDLLVGWMISEDLLTAEGWAGPETAEAPLVTTQWWQLGLVLRRDGEVHARLDNATLENALVTLDFIFKQSLGAARIILRLSWGGAFPDTRVLEGIVVEANRLAALSGQELRYELSLDSWVVTPDTAAFLADYPFHVRLHCGSFALAETVEAGAPAPQEAYAWKLAEKGVRLLSALEERLTVQCVLAGAARLRDLWAWAKDLGVRHLDPVPVEETDPLSPHLTNYRTDLLAIAEEVSAGLAGPQPPVECQPLSRVVGTLMKSEPLARTPRLSTETSWGAGDVYPSEEDEIAASLLGDIWFSLEEREPAEPAAGGDSPCAGCWARYLCSHSVLPSSPINTSADRRDPDEVNCAFWRTEVEVGLRFYHRLAHTDPIQAMRLFDQNETQMDPLDRRYPSGQSKVPF